jgi:multidrug efflux pump subunit AcrA (membrane-fusion protein)
VGRISSELTSLQLGSAQKDEPVMIKFLTPYPAATFSSVIFLVAANAQDNGNNQNVSSTFSGVVAVAKDYSISPEINNKIRRIHFIEGELVRKGDLLVEFDTAEKQFEVAYARASYERAMRTSNLHKTGCDGAMS